MTVKANAYVQDGQRWDPDTYSVKSGARVTLRDKSTDGQPHTLSLIKSLPKTPAQITGCQACGPLNLGHEVDMMSGNVGKPLIEAGAAGFDGRRKDRRRLDLPARQGQGHVQGDRQEGPTLSFVCAVHPWMLGQIKVK